VGKRKEQTTHWAVVEVHGWICRVKTEMIFKIANINHGGTFGEPEVEGESYLEADSLVTVWTRFKKPCVTDYRLRGKWVFRSRTPKGKGFGIWEDNPAFDWERDKAKATAFRAGGVLVTPIKVRKRMSLAALQEYGD
jgi:hypothetical protein